METGAKLTNVVQINLRRRLLPCEQRASPMWAYKPDDPATVQYLFGTTHDKVWNLLFKPQKEWLAEEEDIGLDTAHPPKEVIDFLPNLYSDWPKFCLSFFLLPSQG